jgi:AcrR family transcriptional regulator
MATAIPVSSRRVGRPRVLTSPASSLDPREDVLRVAAVMFIEQGYAATSTRAIADAVGLRQASLFHYFEKKEDILAELLDRTLRPALAFARWLNIETEAGPVALHALVWTDVLNLSTSPDNLASLQLLPEARQSRFDEFWAARDQLRRCYADQVSASLAPTTQEPVELDLIFALVESVLMPYPSLKRLAAVDVASAIADAALRIARVPKRRAAACATGSERLRGNFAASDYPDHENRSPLDPDL